MTYEPPDRMRALRRALLSIAMPWLAAVASLPAQAFDVGLWPNGVVAYKFLDDDTDSPANCRRNQGDLELCQAHKDQVRRMMDIWETALTVTDPLGHTVRYIRFEDCGANCPQDHVLVRYNRFADRPETNNMCTYFAGGEEKVGRNPAGPTELHFLNVNHADGAQPDQVVLHELGHCLGLWHEQNRSDRARWLVQYETPLYCAVHPDECTGNLLDINTRSDALMPRLGNYDYDSIMHYGSYVSLGEPRWADPVGNTFLGDTWAIYLVDATGKRILDAAGNPIPVAPARPLAVSNRDISRVLQYQAHEFYARAGRDWGLFESMSTQPLQANSLPVPFLDEGQRVVAVGSPAIAHQSSGNFDVFSLGSNQRIYWKAYRRERAVIAYAHGKPVFGWRNTVSAWRDIGCCFASEPSAVARAPGRVDVAAINTSGNLQRIKYIDGDWAAPLTLRGGAPAGGNRYAGSGRYIGPAIASRGPDLLDVFVVRSDGRLAVTTWRNGNWEAWQTLGALNYNVTARPAAVATDGDFVQLAINEGDSRLFEPGVTFGAGAPGFALGLFRGTLQRQSPPALTDHTGAPANNRYRVLVTNAAGRISIRGAVGAWHDIGGIPQPGTGPAAASSGDETLIAVMNGENAISCSAPFCHPNAVQSGQVIQPGGLWIRRVK